MVYDKDDPSSSAAPGILTGIILSIGRIVGESAALLFTAGSGFQLPKSLFGKLFESSGTLTIQLYLSMQKAKYDQAFGIAGGTSNHCSGHQPADKVSDQEI